jgi:CheY-like chemotaxis protein
MASIVVIDDEPEVRSAVSDLLARAGHEVRVYADSRSGLTSLRSQLADIVITDVIMPQGNGVDLIAMLRAEFPHLRIIAMSGGGNFKITSYAPDAITTQSYLAAARRMGADTVLSKPFDKSAILDAVNQFCQPQRH